MTDYNIYIRYMYDVEMTKEIKIVVPIRIILFSQFALVRLLLI